MSNLYSTLFTGPQEVEPSGELWDEITEKAAAMTEAMTEEEMYERLFGDK